MSRERHRTELDSGGCVMRRFKATYKRDEVREVTIEAPTLAEAKQKFDRLEGPVRVIDWQQDTSDEAVWEVA